MGSHSGEQLEEGEIVDDDDFEDISDNSIIDPTFGKFVPSNENLRALSLSSDREAELCKNVKRKKKLLPRKSRSKRQKKRQRYRTLSESSDSDVSTCPDLKVKLKEAVHISGIEEAQKNPLEARLKVMWGLSNSPADTREGPHKIEIQDNDKVDDQELETLRIEALKTAVLNKFQRRKRKKVISEEQKEEQKALETLENKENDTPKGEPEKADMKNAVLDIEEDEDVLRASLLAGLAKKITRVQSFENVVQAKPATPTLPVRVAPVLPKLPVNNAHNFNKKVIQNRPKPQVKPLIIKVNGDSDSEEDVKQKIAEPSKIKDLNVITTSVEKFLKEQRAKFETETKKRFQVVHKNKSFLEKSAVKLLPKSQQIEYQQLLKKLKTAERRKRARKIALQKLKNEGTLEAPKVVEQTVSQASNNSGAISKSFQSQTEVELSVQPQAVVASANSSVVSNDKGDGVVQTCETKVFVKPVAVEMKSSGEDVSKSEDDGNNKRENDLDKRNSTGITSELTTLQKTLKEIKMQRNGSLQIKSKYQVLTPIIRKITSTSNERKKQEQRIKHLLQELNEARSNLAISHRKFSALVKELVARKEKVDSSHQDSKTSNKQNGSIIKRTEGNRRKSERCGDNDGKRPVPLTSTPIKDTESPVREETALSAIITANNDYEDMDVCNSDETDVCQIDIVDPNDIDQIFTRKSANRLTIPEYVSPLNLNACERYKHVDPYGIMCPYEVNGSCRDIDCTFKHYLKNSVTI